MNSKKSGFRLWLERWFTFLVIALLPGYIIHWVFRVSEGVSLLIALALSFVFLLAAITFGGPSYWERTEAAAAKLAASDEFKRQSAFDRQYAAWVGILTIVVLLLSGILPNFLNVDSNHVILYGTPVVFIGALFMSQTFPFNNL